MFTCDYCNNEYATKSSLNHHKRTAKKCLLLRESTEQVNFLNCKKCGFQTTLKNTLIMHKCKLENINYVFDKKITELEEENKDLKLKLEKSEEDVIRLATDNINLERKIESYEEKFYTLASRPTISNTTNNTRVDNLLISVDFKESTIKDNVDSNFTLEHLNDGLRGVAKFTKDYIVKPEDGKQKYICSDPSRGIFKYKDENGVVQKDVKATKLKNAIKDPIITKSKSLFIEENSRLFDGIANNEDTEQESLDLINDKITVLKDNFLKVKNIDENVFDYAKEMVLIISE